MIKTKKQMFIVIGVFALVMLLGTVTYAFFNYTRTGTANNIRTGRVSFNTSQDGSINLTNAFPISSTQAQTDTTNAKSVSITVTGDTDYANGLEYLVTASDVNLTIGTGANAKTLPIALEVSVSSNTHGEAPNQITTTLGTAETGDYYANRSSYTESKYKVLYDGELEEDARLLVGYIAPNTVTGTPSGIDGTINIKAYIDSSKILISDTYPSVDVDTNNDNETDYTNGTPSSMADGKTVFTTTEWNSIQGSPLSFKVKVESNEGIWVEELTQVQTAAQQIAALLTETNAAGNKIYTGANANVANYVTFNGESWRIIGVYGDKLKIVKATPLEDKQEWQNSTEEGNTWNGSLLETYLNTTYYNSLSGTAKDMIAEGSWDVGVCGYEIAASAAYTCAHETTLTGADINSNRVKVGLIASYEYLYAAENDGACWAQAGSSYDGYGGLTDCKAKDWLFPTLTTYNNASSNAWTLSPRSANGFTSDALDVFSDGYVSLSGVNLARASSPVVYLKSDVTITGGNGQSGSAYTLSYTGN